MTRTLASASRVLAFVFATVLGNAHAEPCKNHYILDEIPPCANVFMPKRWAPTAPMTGARSAHTASLLADGRVLIVGDSGSAMQAAEIFEPRTHSWRSTEPIAGRRSWHTATVLGDGSVLVLGGGWLDEHGRSSVTTVAEIYDPATDAWRAVSSQIVPRSMHTATLLTDGTVLIAGGWSTVNAMTDDALRSAVLYDPVTATFRPTGDLVAKRYGHTATLLSNGMVLVVGGSNSGDLEWTLSTAELYDPSTGAWSVVEGNLATGRLFHAATRLPSGNVVITGGYTGGVGGGKTLGNADLFDAQTSTWTRLPDMRIRRYGHTATLLDDGRVLVAGGTLQRGGYPPGVTYDTLFDSELFEVESKAWSEAGTLITPRTFHTATRLLDGRVLVTGGRIDGTNASIVVPDAESYGDNFTAAQSMSVQ